MIPIRSFTTVILPLAALIALSCERPAPSPPPELRGFPDIIQPAGAPAETTDHNSAYPKTATTPPEEDRSIARSRLLAGKADSLRTELPDDFLIRAEWPFVVAGNLSRGQFDRIFEGSILGCYECLKRDYFTTEPDRPIVVYLFKDDTDYRKYTRELFGDNPSTPFGYFSPRRRALIMNIGTGTGTLVHEMCHPLIDRDFPGCPTWFNEGFASLHEQCSWLDGSLVGLPNWRLPDLQKAIRAGEALALEDLLEKKDADSFYGDDQGLNYATARYLCQYLQMKGLLGEYYRRLRAGIDEDPTGRKTLETVLESPLAEIEPAFQRWVLTLRFGG